KVDLTNTARKSPVGPHAPTFPLPASNYRNQPNDIWSAELNVRPPKVNICIPILRDYSTRPRSWVQVPVLSKQSSTRLTGFDYLLLPVCGWYSSISDQHCRQRPVLIDTDGAKTPRN